MTMSIKVQSSHVASAILAGITFLLSICGAQADESPMPAPTPSAQPSSPAQQPDSSSAFGFLGDFGGAREILANRGISFRGHLIAESAGNPLGGLQAGTAFASEIMLGGDLDIGRMQNNGFGTVHLTVTAREGSSLSANTIGNIFTVQEIYGSGLTPRLTEASYEQTFGKGKVDVAVGRIITESDFGASPAYWGGNLYCTYQSNAICGTPIAVPINSGYDAYPQSVWGVRVKANPTAGLYIESGAYQVAPNYGQRGEGFNLGFGGTTGTFLPFEVGITSLSSDKSATGNLRVGAYYDTSNVATVESHINRFLSPSALLPASLPVELWRGRYGYWVQADHVIAGNPDSGRRGVVAFLAFNYGDPQTALLREFAEGGIVQHGTFPGRDRDTVAVAYAYGNVNANLRDFETAINVAGYNAPINGQEQIAEVNYGVSIRSWFLIRPGVQYVWRPSGNAAIKNALVVDLSTAISF
jgi:porin